MPDDSVRISDGRVGRGVLICLLCVATALSGRVVSGEEQNQLGSWIRGKDLAWSPFSSVTNLIPRYHAIVIGINQYGVKPPAGWESLTTAKDDAEEIANILEKEYAFKVTRLFDKQATRDAIINALDQLTTFTVDDAVLIYYAGHGFYDEKLCEGFWIPYGARQKSAQGLPREDWIWNSTLSKVIGSSEARHVLVISDSCYSGSLFRGAELSSTKTDLTWYRRAISRPSRYLISSGDMEPVLDSGTRHSIFAQSLINCIKFPEKPIFSASDIGVVLRAKVSTLTGQMVRIGPLSIPANAGGEFVFLTKNAVFADVTAKPDNIAAVAAEDQNTVKRGDALSEPIKLDIQQVLKDAALMNEQGATNTAANTLRLLLRDQPDNQTAKAIAAYFDHERLEKSRAEIRSLVERIEKQKQAAGARNDDLATYAKPRILACLGPENPGGSAEGEAQSLLCRISLRADIQDMGGVILVERDAIQSVLQEMQLGSSNLADPKAQTAIGKLLPASFLLMGELLPGKDGDKLYMRLVDTETSRILATFSCNISRGKDVSDIYSAMAAQIVGKVAQMRPLVARVVSADGGNVRARVGRFHCLTDKTTFAVVQRKNGSTNSPDDYTEKEIGKAKIVSMGELESDFAVDQPLKNEPAFLQNIWIREKPANPK